MTDFLLAAALLAAGYLVGRVRPWRRLDDWNWARTMWRDGTSADGLLWIALHPVKTVRTLRKRNEPESTVYAADLFAEVPDA